MKEKLKGIGASILMVVGIILTAVFLGMPSGMERILKKEVEALEAELEVWKSLRYRKLSIYMDGKLQTSFGIMLGKKCQGMVPAEGPNGAYAFHTNEKCPIRFQGGGNGIRNYLEAPVKASSLKITIGDEIYYEDERELVLSSQPELWLSKDESKLIIQGLSF